MIERRSGWGGGARLDGLKLPGTVDPLGDLLLEEPVQGGSPSPTPEGPLGPEIAKVRRGIRVGARSGGVEDAAGRVVIERRPECVARDVVRRVGDRPNVGAADADARVGHTTNGLGQEQSERIAAGSDDVETQIRVVRVDDGNRDGEVGQGAEIEAVRKLDCIVEQRRSPESCDVGDRSGSAAVHITAPRGDRVRHELTITEVVPGDGNLAPGNSRVSAQTALARQPPLADRQRRRP